MKPGSKSLVWAGVLGLFQSLALMAAPPAIYSVQSHPNAPYEIEPDGPGMNKQWPGRNYPDTIQKRADKKYVFARPMLWGNRCEYWKDDETAQFFAMLPPLGKDSATVRIDLKTAAGAKVASLEEKVASNKISFLVNLADLKDGDYVARAAVGGDKRVAEFAFRKVNKAHPKAAIPGEGIPIVVESQPWMADGVWPVRAGIPLPRGAVTDPARLALFENGQPVAAQVRPRATWAPNGSVQWVHLDFQARYKDGKPLDYRLKLLPQAVKNAPSALTCRETPAAIVVDTGAIRFVVNRKKFNGIETAWFDASAGGKYDEGKPVIQNRGGGGPYLVDEKEVRFEAAQDAGATVTVEEQDPVKVTLRAEGWYTNPQSSEKRLCRYVTRISAFAGSPLLRIIQQTYITYDTETKQLADLGFSLPVKGAKFFELGADGAARQGALPPSPGEVFLHQDRWDHFRVVGGSEEWQGKISDGWFSVSDAKQDGTRVTVALKDIWQKFPKEVSMNQDGLTLHFWPKHGHQAFTKEEEHSLKEILKFLCFHQGRLMDLKVPDDYTAAFDELAKGKSNEGGGWWRPTDRDGTSRGNAQGVVIANEFAVVLNDGAAKDAALGDAAKLAQLFQFDPTASAPPEWNASTLAFGPLAAVDRQKFPEMEEAVEKGFLSWTRGTERGNYYGMFNYAGTHTMWNVPENRAGLYRPWQDSHYHNVGTNWLLYYRSGSGDMLRWARKNTDRLLNISTVNYVDTEDPIKVMDHTLGAMQHVGWKTPWGSPNKGGAWGQCRDIIGHFIDPDAFLWCYYLTGNERAREAYDFWAGSYLKTGATAQLIGQAREVNNTLASVVPLYQATWNPEFLPAIYSMADSLRTLKPLEEQRPGPLWHPLWINRYYEMTRDPQYVPVILKYAKVLKYDESTWAIALAAEAYEISGDKEYLTMHFADAKDWARGFYREDGHPYDWYGKGPGPLGDHYGYLSWGYYLEALKEAGIDQIDPDGHPENVSMDANAPEKSQYPMDSARNASTILALQTEDRPFEVRMKGVGRFGADLHNWKSTVTSPKGNLLHDKVLPEPTAKVGVRGRHEEMLSVPAGGEAGFYVVKLEKADGALTAPVTTLPYEAVVVAKGSEYFADKLLCYLMPSGTNAKVELSFRTPPATIASDPIAIRVKDANGKVLLDETLFVHFRNRTSVSIDPAEAPPPWKVDAVGGVFFKWQGDAPSLLLSMKKESFVPIFEAQARQGAVSGL